MPIATETRNLQMYGSDAGQPPRSLYTKGLKPLCDRAGTITNHGFGTQQHSLSSYNTLLQLHMEEIGALKSRFSCLIGQRYIVMCIILNSESQEQFSHCSVIDIINSTHPPGSSVFPILCASYGIRQIHVASLLLQ